MMTTDPTVQALNAFFPHLSEVQKEQFASLPALYQDWNSKINVISRKDTDNITERHILHSLSIGLFTQFKEDTVVYDVGTGGGFPGIPLAILFPEVHFTLIDSIGKKIKVAQAIADAIGLKNITTQNIRAEEMKSKCDFIVSRAAMPASDLVSIAQKLIHSQSSNALPNGLIALKGGDLTDELKPFRKTCMVEDISTYLPEIPFFDTKKIVYIPI